MRALFCLRANKTAEDFPTRVPTHGIFHLFPNSWLPGCSIHPIAAGGRGGGRRVRPAPRLHGLRQERNGGSSQEEEEEEGGGGVLLSGAGRSERRGGAGRGGRGRRGGESAARGAARIGACHARRGGRGSLAGSACVGCAAASAWWPPCWGCAGAAGTAPTSSWTVASAPPSEPRGPAARLCASKWSAAEATWWKLCSPPYCPTAPCPCEYGPRAAHLAEGGGRDAGRGGTPGRGRTATAGPAETAPSSARLLKSTCEFAFLFFFFPLSLFGNSFWRYGRAGEAGLPLLSIACCCVRWVGKCQCWQNRWSSPVHLSAGGGVD